MKEEECRDAVKAEACRHGGIVIDVIVQPAYFRPAELLGCQQDLPFGDVAVGAVSSPKEKDDDAVVFGREIGIELPVDDALHGKALEELGNAGVGHGGIR